LDNGLRIQRRFTISDNGYIQGDHNIKPFHDKLKQLTGAGKQMKEPFCKGVVGANNEILNQDQATTAITEFYE